MYDEIGKKLKDANKETIAKEYHLKKEGDEGLPEGEMPDFSKAIKALRSQEDLSLEKLSALTGIKKQTLHSIENYSTRNPSFPNLEKIATALKISLNDLILMARSEFQGNLFKTTAAQRWTASFDIEKGFSIYSYSPPSISKRDFFVGVMTIRGGKKLKHWKFMDDSKGCIQPWDGELLFIYHGMNWRKEMRVLPNETLYYDASIPHTFENLSDKNNRVLLVTYPSIF
ncbi:MAG: helix-turn-helix domain-containing protein [Candidatus Omnitrophica bacterium]|nr:helix-turn-helix domain-containing protein [Candidatus Omnitrophota bacterium]